MALVMLRSTISPVMANSTVIATLVGCALAWGGLVVPVLRPLYDYAWFVGFFAAGLLYVAMMRGTRRAVRAEPSAQPRLAR